MNKENKDIWIYEREDCGIEPLFTKIKWKIKETIYKGKSEYQEIAFYNSYDHGIIFTLDDVIMTTERDEFIYHEAISHIPIFSHPSPKKLLVIGGGDLGTIREAIKHSEINEIHLCEIDKMVTDKCLDILKYTKRVVEDNRVKLFFEDGFSFLKNKMNYYDIIIVDSSDPVGEAEKLFGESFFKIIYDALKEDGLMSMQCGSPLYNTDFIVSLNGKLKEIFPISKLYTASCHSYPGGYWGFLLGSKKYSPVVDFQEDKYNKANINCKYYNKSIHKAAFALPEYIKKLCG